MSHTSTYRINGSEVIVHHNSDWSGEATVRWQPDGGPMREAYLPAAFLVQLGEAVATEALKGALQSTLETAIDNVGAKWR